MALTAASCAVGDTLSSSDLPGPAAGAARTAPCGPGCLMLGPDDVSGNLGISVAMSGDTAVVGAYEEDPGAVYVYVRVGGAWTLQQKLTAADGTSGDFFGYATAIQGDTILVGADNADRFQGAAYVFTRRGEVWLQQAKLRADDGVPQDLFGGAVALDGDTAVVSNQTLNVPSAAYVFARAAGAWSQQAELLAADGKGADAFGSAVGIVGDTVVVGAPDRGSGAVYVFARVPGPSRQEGEITAGSALVWTQQQVLTPDAGADAVAEFGMSLAIEGGTLVVGAPTGALERRAAYVFAGSGASWSLQQKLAPPPDSTWDDFFSHAVALRGDTLIAADRARAHVFTRSGGTWTLGQELSSADLEFHPFGEDYDFSFGASVATDGAAVYVGGFTQAGDNGAAYVFDLSP